MSERCNEVSTAGGLPCALPKGHGGSHYVDLHDASRYECKQCNVGFSLLEDLVNHRTLVHPPMRSVMSDAKRWEQLAEDLFDLAFLEDDESIAQACLIYATQAASIARAKRQAK